MMNSNILPSETVEKNDDIDTHHPITCFICVDTYNMKKKPMILVCGHTFCEVCLQNMFDTSNEIQCCFCKVITKLDKFEDMIVNYAILSLAEHSTNNTNDAPVNGKYPNKSLKSSNCFCDLTKKNPDNVEKLLQCIDCKRIVCSMCISNDNSIESNVEKENSNNSTHRNHKLTNLIDYINNEASLLSDCIKNYRDLANKMAINQKKIDKAEIDKIIRQEKESIATFFREFKNLIDKNQEIMLHNLDKLQKDAYKAIDNFKREVKYFNNDSTRYCSIVEEMCNFKNITNKQRAKVLNIYNVNSTFDEIKEFNKEVQIKTSRLLNPELFMKKFIKIVKSCEIYRNKMFKFHNLIYKKSTNLVEKGFESKIKFYCRKNA